MFRIFNVQSYIIKLVIRSFKILKIYLSHGRLGEFILPIIFRKEILYKFLKLRKNVVLYYSSSSSLLLFVHMLYALLMCDVNFDLM